MDKYISANKFRAMMYHEAFEEDSDLQRWDGGCWIRYKMFENALDQIEPADVQEVKHGRWKPFDLTWGRSIYACTSCGEAFEVPTEWGKPMYKFCPHCGASMRGDEE